MELPAAYLAAVADAETAGPDQMAPSLVALTPGAANVVFNADGTAAEMVTLTDWTGYAANVGAPMELTREVWLTPVPELQDFCRSYVAAGGTDPSLRSLQYMGMPPRAKPVTMVTMMVPLAGMFRPTPDPQIDDTTAVYDDGTVQPADPAYPNHADWFRLQKALTWQTPTPGPGWATPTAAGAIQPKKDRGQRICRPGRHHGANRGRPDSGTVLRTGELIGVTGQKRAETSRSPGPGVGRRDPPPASHCRVRV